MELSEGWVAAAADEGLRRAYPRPDFDDRSWVPIAVPGHWRSNPAFAAHDGPLLHRHHFDASRPDEGRRAWLTFDGIFYQADVWLDGGYVGDTEGYFFPHTFEVTDALRAAAEHTLAVEVACTRPTDRTAKRNLTGVFQHWDCIDPDANPGGIWRPVRLTETGPVRIARLRVLCTEASAERAVLEARAVLDAASAGPVRLRMAVTRATTGEVVGELTTDHTLAAGENRIREIVRLTEPDLWWPHALGPQPLHDVTVEVLQPDDGRPGPEVSHRCTRRTGVRQVRMKNWIVTVNGERMFLKGSNQGPTRAALAEATPDELAADVTLAKSAGLDLLRIHAHVTRPELYDAADREGLLLWQDLPLQWGYARGIRRQAVRQAREAVDLLAHHPALAIWCGHNEPLALDVEPGVLDASPVRTAARFAALQELPTWNKTVLDSSLKRALEKADPTRPVIAHSGVFPGPVSGGTDTHWYFGWYHGHERDFPRVCAAVPRLARFVTEFGAQAVPNTDGFLDPGRWPDLDWDQLGRHYALQKAVFDRWVPPGDFATLDDWREATQAYQGTVIRHHIETLRRLKYRPTGGFCQFSLADSAPGVTWAVVDHARVAKTGFAALAAACAPVIVVADRPAETYRPGEPLSLDIHAVSDLRSAVTPVRVTATLTWISGHEEWTWEGDLPADDCVRIGTVRSTVADAPGALVLDLDLRGPGVAATSRYEARIEAETVSA
jgi:beta-mannosidase